MITAMTAGAMAGAGDGRATSLAMAGATSLAESMIHTTGALGHACIPLHRAHGCEIANQSSSTHIDIMHSKFHRSKQLCIMFLIPGNTIVSRNP